MSEKVRVFEAVKGQNGQIVVTPQNLTQAGLGDLTPSRAERILNSLCYGSVYCPLQKVRRRVYRVRI